MREGAVSTTRRQILPFWPEDHGSCRCHTHKNLPSQLSPYCVSGEAETFCELPSLLTTTKYIVLRETAFFHLRLSYPITRSWSSSFWTHWSEDEKNSGCSPGPSIWISRPANRQMADAKHMRINKPLHNAFHPNRYKWVNKKFVIASPILKVKACNSHRNENTYPKSQQQNGV